MGELTLPPAPSGRKKKGPYRSKKMKGKRQGLNNRERRIFEKGKKKRKKKKHLNFLNKQRSRHPGIRGKKGKALFFSEERRREGGPREFGKPFKK